jgi:ligand-binding sensor domain-containing protein/signal transduction histidine kinase/DNA-binding response OmpR family regulator
MLKFRLILATLFILIATAGWAQRLDFTHLTPENGLSQKSVLAIAQDSHGFMWFGTADGLNRYDSRDFKVYSTASGLHTSYILCILEDSKNTLWAGTRGGMFRYQPQTDNFVQVRFSRSDSYAVNCTAEDRQHRVWAGTGDGLYLINGITATRILQTAGSGINAITTDANGNICAGTDNGLVEVISSRGAFSFRTVGHNEITSLVLDTAHRLWVGTRHNGIALYDAATQTFVHYPSQSAPGSGADNIRKLILDKNGKLWVATQDGLLVFDVNTKQFTSYRHNAANAKSLNQNSLYSVFFDKQNTLWVGTYYGGVNIAMPVIFNHYQNDGTSAGLSNNVVSSIVEDKEHNLWVGTEGGGLNHIDRKTNKVTVFHHQRDNSSSIGSDLVKAVYRDHDGNIWAGTHGGGLNVLPAGQNKFIHYFYKENDAGVSIAEIWSFAENADGYFFIATNNGMTVYKRNHTTLLPLPDSGRITHELNGLINYLLEDSKGRVWAGGTGLFVFDKSRACFVPVSIPGEAGRLLSNVGINCIAEDSNGNIWIGTALQGLFKLDPVNHRLTVYTENDGLANNNVYGIVQDNNGDMWISTGNGLSKLSNKTAVIHNFTTRDGLPGNEFNKNSFARLSDEQLAFGGFNGLVIFDPKSIKEQDDKPTAFITDLKLFNKELPGVGGLNPDKKISLKYNQNVFTVDFVILNYIRAEKNRYAYQIKGVDNNWNYTRIPSVTYNNLPPGQYYFMAKGQNNDGVWSDPVSMLITIQPPWWQTWWAYCLYAVMLAAVIFFIARYFFLQALLRKDHEMTEMKLNFFNNISHEIRTYLSLISAPLEQLLKAKTAADNDKDHLNIIKKNSDELLELVQELMDFRKAETGNLSLHISHFNLVTFIQSIQLSFRDLVLDKNITTDLVYASENIELYFDRVQMKKVFFNLLSNAYKFTPVNGYVRITIEEDDQMATIKIADNGKGLSPENIEKLFRNYFQENDSDQQNIGYGIGLALSKSIVQLHGGTLMVESPGRGSDSDMSTVFTLCLKIGSAHFTKDQFEHEHHVEDIRDYKMELPAITPEAGPGAYCLLIVEDNRGVRNFIADSFRGTYRILEAPDGQAGFDIAAEHIPDLIISDVMMPGMNGYDFCHQIKTDERTNHIPVILLTANASVDKHLSGLKMGADTYLTKPFSIPVLELQVKNLIASAERLRQRYSKQLSERYSLESKKQDAKKDNEPVVENDFINKIIALTELHLSDPTFDVEKICRNIGMSQAVLYRKMRAITSVSVNDIVKEVRFKQAAAFIAENKYTVYEVADMVGYTDTKYFSKEFKKLYGVSPRDYKLQQTEPSAE